MRLIVALIAMLAFSGAALAKPLPDGGVTAEDMATVLSGRGQPFTITKDSAGNPLINTAQGETKFDVYFLNRTSEGRFYSIQFAVGFRFRLTPEQVSVWNRTKRFGRVYINTDGAPWLEMDIETSKGISTEGLEANLGRWASVLGEFKKYAAPR